MVRRQTIGGMRRTREGSREGGAGTHHLSPDDHDPLEEDLTHSKSESFLFPLELVLFRLLSSPLLLVMYPCLPHVASLERK